MSKQTAPAHTMVKGLVAATLVIALIAVLSTLFGQRIYLNLRGPDPILAGWEEFDQSRFEARAIQGETQLVEIYATWCPTCLAQHKAFETLVAEGRAPDVRAIGLDFDRDAAYREKLGINFTGALLVFKGEQQVATGVHTTPDAIVAFLKSVGIGSGDEAGRAEGQTGAAP